ncbi:hypothetical protein [Amycolatopsis sp. cmx-4-54]|uniref:hypothetical protein n=1 Tax=Amycolatopsis sp. cmx-4-54 TaxID=2790936 RepID=UPI003978E1AB
MALQNYPMRAWAAGPPPVTAFDMEQLSAAIRDLDNRAASLEAGASRRVASAASAATGSNMSFGTSEAVGAWLQPNLSAGRRYRTRMTFVANATTAGTNGFFRLEQTVGTTVGTGGTLIPGGQAAPNLSRGAAGDNSPVSIEGEFVASQSGVHTIAFTGRSGAGTVNVPADAANHAWLFTVDDVT